MVTLFVFDLWYYWSKKWAYELLYHYVSQWACQDFRDGRLKGAKVALWRRVHAHVASRRAPSPLGGAHMAPWKQCAWSLKRGAAAKQRVEARAWDDGSVVRAGRRTWTEGRLNCSNLGGGGWVPCGLFGTGSLSLGGMFRTCLRVERFSDVVRRAWCVVGRVDVFVLGWPDLRVSASPRSCWASMERKSDRPIVKSTIQSTQVKSTVSFQNWAKNIPRLQNRIDYSRNKTKE
jgi:hypothetical protein